MTLYFVTLSCTHAPAATWVRKHWAEIALAGVVVAAAFCVGVPSVRVRHPVYAVG